MPLLNTSVWNLGKGHSACAFAPGLCGLLIAILGVWACFCATASPALTTLEYRVVGSALRVSPTVLSVPKGVAGSVLVELSGGAAGQVAGGDGYIEATLRGPSFAARRIVGQPGAPLVLPALPLVGDYQLDNIRLVDAATGATKMEAAPSSVPVRVFDEVLVSRVTSRPLTLEEIQEKGIAIDEANFRAVEFEVGFVLDGKTIPVTFPVVAPRFTQSTEIIPAAELEKKLTEAAILNQQIASTVELPPELEQSQLNIQITGINFQRVEVGEEDLALRIPPIPALVVIPGNIGFLNQFFSAQIFTENAAPGGSGLSVNNVQATMVLPAGSDRIASTNYTQPGDDPLRFARVGPDKIIQPTQPVVRAGPDGKLGTADDVPRLFPGESGSGEFLVEGLQEGLHVMDIELLADLEGLAAGVVKIKGKAAGSVLVRNPKFSLAFAHPRTIRAGEPYEASVTILNTSISPANLVRVSLPSTSLSGGVLETPETVELGTILPGQSATATYRIRAQKTGSISFSNLTTSDESTEGRFRLSMGIDERGVVLSPDTIAMPDYVQDLPVALLAAANRVLGQALSVATAGQLPPGVLKVPKSVITKRVLELAEAGQRLRYGDGLNRVLADLQLDWQGGRTFNGGFDQILRVTDAGREFRDALVAAQEQADALDAVERLAERAPDLAGRGEAWTLAAVGNGSGVQLSLHDGTNTVVMVHSDIAGANGYSALRGQAIAAHALSTNAHFSWNVTSNVASAELAVLLVGTNGTGRQLRWTLANPAAGSCFSFSPDQANAALIVDANCDGVPDSTITGAELAITERPPEVIAVLQDPGVHQARPARPCFPTVPLFPLNYGTVVAVLFSKPLTQNGVDLPTSYVLDNGNRANSVQIQPGGRVALLNLAQPVGALRQRTMVVTGVADPRGNQITAGAKPLQGALTAGVTLRGRVVRADGSFAAAVPVTLTYYDRESSGFGECPLHIARVSQVFTDADGAFSFDFVLSGIPYSVSATDTAGLPPDAVRLLIESTVGDQFAQDKLRELLDSQANQDTLLTALAAPTVQQAIALAEGVDRALLRDQVLLGSPREGTEMVVALRFRGRGVVAGQVLAADGINPVADVAINLFPDPDARELGRGVFSDANGRFAFFGVPLGNFTVQATAPSRQSRTVAGTLDEVGETNALLIVLSTNISQMASLRGRVFEPDTITPHPGARVFIGRFDAQGRFTDVVAATTADNEGFWAATDFPAGTYDVAAVSFDGKRKGDRRSIGASPGLETQVSISLNGRTTVSGRVEFSTGIAATNALVAGGDSIVRTDAQGLFTLSGVPTGRRTISAGVERDPEAGIDFPRLGSASLEVVDGLDNFIVVRLRPAGRIVGRVLDALGQPVPNTRVAIPRENGFLWVDTDSAGNYKFENLGLDNYTLSAPAPGVAKTDTSGLIDRIRGGNETEILAAFGEALRIFTGVDDPFLNGAPFNPVTWGFTRAQLTFDGQTANADIRLLRPGTVSGVVLNGQRVPIGAKVRLTGLGPLANGAPSFVIKGDINSDAALGTFTFTNGILVGPFGLQAASPFFNTVIETSGQTTSTEPNSTNNVLRFPPTRETAGRLTGVVFYPDGTRTGSNVTVKISFGDDYSIRTDTNGFFDTQIGLPAGGYLVEASDPLTGLRGVCQATVLAGVTNVCDVELIGKGALRVLVKQANGSAANNAAVTISQGTYPRDRFSGTAGTNGIVQFENIFAGFYGVEAAFITGPTTIFGRSSVSVNTGATGEVTVVLGPTATLRGTFVKRDLVTPIGFAQISVGTLGFATTDAEGRFELTGVPLGTYRLRSEDPVTGAGAVLEVALNSDGEVRTVTLVEQARGEIRGFVVNGYGTGFVPGALVMLTMADSFVPPRSVTTGPDGAFSFPGTPSGAFTLRAEDPTKTFKGIRHGSLTDTTPLLQADVQLDPLARITGTIFEPNGAPATNASVRLILGGRVVRSTDADANGRVSFADLLLGDYLVRADSRRTGATRSTGTTNLSLSISGNAPDFAVSLLGVGTVSGTVFLSDGATPASAAEVTLTSQADPLQIQEETQFTSTNGVFSFSNVPAGPYTVSAKAVALGVSGGGSIVTNGETDVLTLVLGASGSVVGTLMRADGSNAAPGIDVVLSFTSQSGLPGIAVTRSDSDGAFSFANIPVGQFNFEAVAASFNGIARFRSNVLTNGQVLNLGNVLLDEADPRVAAVDPPNTSVGVPITTAVTLIFSEPLATNSLNTNGIFLRRETLTVPVSLQALPDTNGLLRIIRLTPRVPLISERAYQVVAIDGERLDAQGSVIASGPTDLVGRPMALPFVSTFTTADNDPPLRVSLFPANGEVQIDPRAVLRLAFNEPIRGTNFGVRLTGPAGPLSGTASVGLNGLVLTFAPDAPLPINSSLTLTVSNIFDLAGNRAVGEPFTAGFQTLDTLGPDIAQLRIGDGRSPVAGGTVPVEAILASAETGASVRFTQTFNAIGAAATPPFRVNAKLPDTGSTTIRAIATDRFGNDGPVAELVISVVPNQQPSVTLARGVPATGPLTNGQPFTLTVSATDDLGVSNIVVVGIGTLPFSTNFIGGGQRTVALTVPTNAAPGGLFQFRAQATDVLGVASSEAVLQFALIDGIRPMVTILSPPENSALNPAQPLTLVTATSDNGTDYGLQVTLGGAITATQSLDIVAAPAATVTNRFDFALTNAPADGGALTVAVRAVDASTNVTTVSRAFRIADVRPPQLASASPTNGAPRQSLWSAGVFDFDEALSAATVTTNNIRLTNSATVPTPFSLTLANGNRRVAVVPSQALRPGVTYTNVLLPGLTDISSNGWRNIGGVEVPGTGVEFTFTTASILAVTPTNGSPVTAGQNVSVNVDFEPSLGANFFRFQVNGGAATQVNAGAGNASAVLTVPLSSTQAVISITASDDQSFTRPFTLPQLTLPVLGDTRPPQLISGTPTNGAARQSLWLSGVFEFDEALDPTTVTTNSLELGNSAGTATQFDVALANGNRRMIVSPARPLRPGVTYTNTLLPGIADPSGNRWRNIGDQPVPPNGAPYTFATAAVLGVSPTNGSSVFEGQALNAAVNFEPGLGANFFRFEITGSSPVTVAAGTDSASAVLFAPNGTTQAVIRISASPDNSFAEPSVLAPVTVSVAPLIGDLDGDGIPDDQDPDIDGDSLANTNEVVLGTDPRKVDTDGDLWRDPVEVEAGSNPLLASSVPLLFHVAEPTLGLILPAFTDSLAVTNGVFVAQPQVGLILPRSAEDADVTNGVTVAQPAVGLILPAVISSESTAEALTVAQPQIGLILPSNPDLSSSGLGVVVAQPVITLHFQGPGGLRGLAPAPTLRLAIVPGLLSATDTAGTNTAWSVVMEWSGPAGSYAVEASTNLHDWTSVEAELLSSANGTYRVRCDGISQGTTFFRLRYAP